MAKQVSVIQVNGRVGEVVGAKSMKGDNILRVHRATIANPNTIPQQTQRTKFLAVSNFANTLPAQAIMGLRPYAKSARCSMRNALTKLYLLDPTNGDQNGLIYVSEIGGVMTASINQEQMFFSKGILNTPLTSTPQFDNPLEVTFTATIDDAIDRARTNLIVIIRADDGETTCKILPVPAEGNLNVAITTPATWNGRKVRIYSYYQSFGQAEQRNIHYTAFLNGAKSTLVALESSAEYSNTHWVGQGNIS